MTNQKPQQESWQEKLIDPEINGMLFEMIRDDVTIKDLKNVISTERTNAKQEERTKLLNEVREVIKNMRSTTHTPVGGYSNIEWLKKSDLLQALNKLEGENKCK